MLSAGSGERRCREPSLCRLGGVMKMFNVEATGSGARQAEDSKARAQHAGYGARPGGRPRRPGRATASFEKTI